MIQIHPRRWAHAAALALGGVLGAAGATSAETVLTFNKWLPDANVFQAAVITPWAEAVEAATEGRVRVEFTASSLAPPPRQYDLLRSGAVDLIFSSIGYNPDRFPVSMMTSMPYLGADSRSISRAYWDLYQTDLAQAGEFRGIELMGAVAGPPGHIFTATPVAGIEDYAGLKIRSGDALLSEAITNLGAVPVFGPAPQSYEMLSTGVIDGGGYFFDAVLDFNIAPLVPHVVELPGGFINGTFYIAMNEAKWRALSEADRAAIRSVSGEAFAETAGAALDARNAVALDKLLAEGLTVVTPDAAFQAKMASRLAPIEAGFLQSAEGRGVDAPAAFAELRALAQTYAAEDAAVPARE